jgi:O-succinylbenzoate synthase
MGPAVSPLLRLRWRPFAFTLPQAMLTAQGAWRERRGWLLRLEAPDGRLGWGEAAPAEASDAASPQPVASAFPEHPGPWAEGLAALAPQASRADLEACLPRLPAPLAFALGAALAELDGLVGTAAAPWRPAPPSAWLLPAGEAALESLRALLVSHALSPEGSLTVKWKLAAHPDPLERRLLEELLALLPPTARLRLDANGGWDRPTATAWADRMAGEPRLEWLEQPLPPGDQEGLDALAERIPVALDESLRVDPSLRQRWAGWQVRRPALEGDPRPLLAELRDGRPRLMVSTALETGIGRRWLDHLAALQTAGPTPTAPGLAPGWTPEGPLFAADPLVVWEAAA